jgi:hypothetical protein
MTPRRGGWQLENNDPKIQQLIENLSIMKGLTYCNPSPSKHIEDDLISLESETDDKECECVQSQSSSISNRLILIIYFRQQQSNNLNKFREGKCG